MPISARLILLLSLTSSATLAQTTPAPPPAPPGATAPAAPTATTPAPAPAAPQGPAPYVYPQGNYPVPVDIVGVEPNLRFTISDKEGRPIAECPGNCRLLLPPGRYKVFVHGTEDTLPGSRNVDISGPSTVRVDPDTHAHRDGGLALGIAGPILMLVGMVALLGNECWECSAEERERRNDERRVPNTLAGLGLIGGLAITPIGWVMFGTSFKPEVEVDTGAPRATSRALRRSPSLSAVITF